MKVIDLLQQCIKINTVSPPGNERDLAAFLADILSEACCTPVLQDLGNNRANLICEIGQGDDLLILNGHLDVVPVAGTWLHQPFAADTSDGEVYGRGSADMKAGLAAMLMAFLSFVPHKDELKGTLRLVFVCDEETANLGTNAYFEKVDDGRFLRKWAVIGEPTSLRVCNGHLGAQRYWIHCNGVTAHSSKPEMGRNAVVLAAKVVEAIEKYHRELRSRASPLGSCQVTLIEGGEKQNSIPGSCKLYIDRRTTPKETKEQVDAELTELMVKELGPDAQYIQCETAFDFGSGYVEPNSLLVRTAGKVLEEYFGAGKGAPIVFPAGCEQGIFVRHGVETIVLGPGAISLAHMPNEHVPINEVEQSVDIYKKMITRLLQ